MHLNDPRSFTHVPRFMHGSRSHSSTSWAQVVPVQPCLQWHLKDPIRFWHSAPFLHKSSFWHSFMSIKKWLGKFVTSTRVPRRRSPRLRSARALAYPHRSRGPRSRYGTSKRTCCRRSYRLRSGRKGDPCSGWFLESRVYHRLAEPAVPEDRVFIESYPKACSVAGPISIHDCRIHDFKTVDILLCWRRSLSFFS